MIATWQQEKASRTRANKESSDIPRQEVSLPPKDKEEMVAIPVEVEDHAGSPISVILNHKKLRNGIQYEVVLKGQKKSKWMAASKIDPKDSVLIAYNRTHTISL